MEIEIENLYYLAKEKLYIKNCKISKGNSNFEGGASSKYQGSGVVSGRSLGTSSISEESSYLEASGLYSFRESYNRPCYTHDK